MPPLVPYANCLKIDIEWSIGTDLAALTRVHWTYTGTAPSNATCSSIASSIHAAIVAQMIPYVGATNALEQVTVTDLTSATSGTGSHAATVAGSRAGAPIAAENCFLLNFRIGRRYRGGKPRIYLPYGTDADILSPQLWQTTSLTNFTSSWATGFVPVVDAISVAGTVMGVQVSLSYYEGFTAVTNPITGRTRDVPKPRTVAISPDVVLTYSGNPKIASQRRREQH